MSDEQGKSHIYWLHKECQDMIMEANAIQRLLWEAAHTRQLPDSNKILLSAIEASRRAEAVLKMAMEIRDNGWE